MLNNIRKDHGIILSLYYFPSFFLFYFYLSFSHVYSFFLFPSLYFLPFFPIHYVYLSVIIQFFLSFSLSTSLPLSSINLRPAVEGCMCWAALFSRRGTTFLPVPLRCCSVKPSVVALGRLNGNSQSMTCI